MDSINDQQKNQEQDFYYCAVYDGHGSSGKEASQAVNDYIQQYLEDKSKKIKKMHSHKKIHNSLKASFQKAEKMLKSSGIDFSASGTCAISVFIKE